MQRVWQFIQQKCPQDYHLQSDDSVAELILVFSVQLYIISVERPYQYLPIHGDVEHISWAHNSLIANNIFKMGKLLIIGIIKIDL